MRAELAEGDRSRFASSRASAGRRPRRRGAAVDGPTRLAGSHFRSMVSIHMIHRFPIRSGLIDQVWIVGFQNIALAVDAVELVLGGEFVG